MDGEESQARPRWRGVLHQWAAVYALGVASALVALAPDDRTRLACALYGASLATLFGVSALYHRVTWRPRARAWLRRADHAAIYLLIGGTYAPVALLALEPGTRRSLLGAIGIGVVVGVLVALLWPRAPKWVGAATAVALGWTVVPFLPAITRALGTLELWLFVAGGLAYTAGAVVYATRRPDPRPASFGYHEVFHALTLVGAALHLWAILAIVRAHAA